MRRKKSTKNRLQLGIAVVLCAGLGTILLIRSHALTSALALEAEQGTISSPASLVSDTTASAGKAVLFGSASSVNQFRLFGPTSLWNTVKNSASYVYADGATSRITSIFWGVNNDAFSHPLYIAKPSDPLTTFTLGAGWGQPATTMTINAPSGMQQASGTDAVMDVLETNGTLLDLYGVSGSGTSWKATYYGLSDGVNGTGFGVQPYTAIGTTAIGSAQAGGTILASDIAAGTIPHALTLACDYADEGGVGTSGASQVPPAVANDDGGASGPLTEGGFLIIPTGTAMPSGLSTMGNALWTAASKYGAYITDQAGGGCYFYGDRSASINTALTASDFSVVGKALRLVKTW